VVSDITWRIAGTALMRLIAEMSSVINRFMRCHGGA
jgi:hypothetical protein